MAARMDNVQRGGVDVAHERFAYLPELGTDLVTALSSLDVNNFSHDVNVFGIEKGAMLSRQSSLECQRLPQQRDPWLLCRRQILGCEEVWCATVATVVRTFLYALCRRLARIKISTDCAPIWAIVIMTFPSEPLSNFQNYIPIPKHPT